jgi:ABC-type arginine transport system ATPase subunit
MEQELTIDEQIANIKKEFTQTAMNLGIYTHEFEQNKKAFEEKMSFLDAKYKELMATKPEAEEVTDGSN